MVSLEEQNNYLTKAIKNEKLLAFYSLLQLSKFKYSSIDLSEIDEIYYRIINSVIKNSRKDFKDCYKVISKRIPTENSPFIHNDLLIFSIILAVFIFKVDRNWIKMVIGKRTKSSISTTFENILNENYQSNSNVQEIVTVFLYLTKERKLTSDILEFTYKSILNNSNLFENKNDFHIIISLKAFESILSLIKEFPNREEHNFLKSFEIRFKKRIKIFSSFIYSLFLLLAVYYLYVLVSLNKDVKAFLDNLNAVLGLFGYLAISGGLFAAFRKKFELSILKLFGYNKNVE
ncbi:hypothetical protein [uncultured Winogradskyella sp.]|uniref:hypothetical protein n=1 Tax=uncultured Winogradskyella sp. TaxID=395353 RepID=UPI002635EC2A|nr:hypothetical protein [uncultured Winogradskyella sp.]